MAFCIPANKSDRTVNIETTCSKCRYHRKDGAFRFDQMGPGGLCPEAFHALYPAAFAMFTAPASRIPDGTKVVCPAGDVQMVLYRRPFRQLKFLAEQIIRRLASLILPVEVLRWRIFARVEEVTGPCAMEHKKGEVFEINLGNTPDLCPAAGNTFYPYLSQPGGTGNSGGPAFQAACPDHLTDVRISCSGFPTTCQGMGNLAVEVLDTACPDIPFIKKGDRFKISDLLQKAGLPCLSYLNTIAPYVQSLWEDGRLGYYTETYDAAMVQCPSAAHKVVTRVERAKPSGPGDEKRITFSVTSSLAPCPLNMNKEGSYTVDSREGYLWLRILHCLSPYLLNRNAAMGTQVVFNAAYSAAGGPGPEPIVFKVISL